MTLPTFTLSGKALTGIDPHLHSPAVMAGLPTQVKLGCRGASVPRQPLPPNLGKYLNLAAIDFPARLDWSASAAGNASISRVFRNAGPNPLGCCVVASDWHGIGIQAGMDTGQLVAPTDAQIEQLYHDACGPGDIGCYMTAVSYWLQYYGAPASDGSMHTIDAFVGIPVGDIRFVKATILLMGGIAIGMNFPEAWFSSDVWGPTESKIVGGHDVRGFGWDEEGVLISSWGRKYKMLWPLFSTIGRWVFGYVASVGPDWWNADRIAPNGIDAATLKKDIEILGRGEFPPITPNPGSSDTLMPGGVLKPGDTLVSDNKRFVLVMQKDDGNLVLRDLHDEGKPLWHAWTFGHPGAFAKEQSEDGNFVVYKSDGVTPLWHAWTFGHPGARVILQNDGNLVVKVGNDPPIWNSQTGGH